MKSSSSLESYCQIKATKVVGIASDHGGYELKEYLSRMLLSLIHISEPTRPY